MLIPGQIMLQNCRTVKQRGRRIKVSFVSSPTKISGNSMSEEGLSSLHGWISTHLSLLTKVFSSSREKSCCFTHILLDHAASSDTDSHVFPFMGSYACAQLSPSWSLPALCHCHQYVSDFPLPSLPVLATPVFGCGVLTLHLCLGAFNLFMRFFVTSC